MDEKQVSLGSLLLVGSGSILTASGAVGGRLVLATGGLALLGTAAGSLRRVLDRSV